MLFFDEEVLRRPAPLFDHDLSVVGFEVLSSRVASLAYCLPGNFEFDCRNEHIDLCFEAAALHFVEDGVRADPDDSRRVAAEAGSIDEALLM